MKEIPVSVTANNGNDITVEPATNTTKGLAWYTCGPTTYSAMHLGHARTYVWLDMMRRVLEFVASAQGAPPPLFVMNITDIDDKILSASAEGRKTTISHYEPQYRPPLSISRNAEANFWKDMERLGCQQPQVTTRVSEYVETDIIPYIQRLIEQEMAYEADNGIYFDVQAFEARGGTYGKLAGRMVQSASDSDSGSNLERQHPRQLPFKRDKRDFALWKLQKPEEDVYWTSPWGNGRPGWHIECSAMIEAVQHRFQDSYQFLVHAGGSDLKFPHHTNEIAQAEAYHYNDNACHKAPRHCSDHSSTNSPNSCSPKWIPHWIHTGHLMVKQSKMSKSLKNFLTVDELWFAYDPLTSSQLDSPADDFRLWCLMGGNYGQRDEYSRSKLLGARQNREKILRFLVDGERWIGQRPRGNDEDIKCYSISDEDKRWGDDDCALFNTVGRARMDAYRALLNNMRGTKYVQALLCIAETGNAHIRETNRSAGSTSVEPVRVALQNLRNLLSLVGFTELTVGAGLQQKAAGNKSVDGAASSYVAGGETAIIQELVRFRASVRTAALEDVKNKKGSDSVKAILKACDELRDSLPVVGIEVVDSKKEKDPSWRFCVPKDIISDASSPDEK